MTHLEIAVQDVAGAVVSAASGADRLELCAALAATGGLTPSIGLLDAVLAALPAAVGVHVLVRPRAGSFVYSADELDVQVRDVRAAIRAGAAGVVVGALDPSGSVDTDALARLVAAADGREVTFHRAFDTLASLGPALDALASLEVTRVLTSGGAPRSIDGVARLTETVARAAGRVQVMAGGGVRPQDIPALVVAGVDAVHLSASRHVDESGGPGGGSAGYTTTDPDVVAAAVAALGRS
jgi:copper homeostasis protein